VRLRRGLLLGVLAIPLAVAVAGWWLLATESGGRWAVQQAARQLPGLTLGGVSGTLLDALQLTQLHYRDADGTELQLAELSLRWRPWALTRHELRLTELAMRGLQLRLPESDAAAEAMPIPEFSLPLPVRVERLSIVQASVEQGEQRWVLDALSGTLRLDADGLQLSGLQLQGEGARVSGEARFAGIAPHPLSATLDWQLQRDELPALSGRLQLTGDLQTLHLDQQLGGAVTARISGSLQPDFVAARHRFELRGEWSQLSLPMADAELHSEQGVLTIRGELSDYQFELDARLQHPETGQLMARLAGRGDGRQLRIVSGSLQGWEGELGLTGQLAWLPLPSWDLAVQARGINPASRWSEWAGSLNLDAALRGSLPERGPELDLDIARLDGQLRDYPVAARGRLMLKEGRWRARGLRLRSGDNQLELDGSLLPRLDLRLALDAPNLAQLAPGMRGQLQGHGQLRGAPDQLAGQLDVRGHDLNLAGLQARELLLTADIDPADARRSHWRFSGKDIGDSDRQAQLLEINGSGNAADHRFSGRLQDAQLQADFTASGAYRQDAWQGELNALTLTPESLGAWTLQAPVAVHADPQQLRVARLCLGQGDARVCAHAARQAAGDFDAEGDWQGLPLALLRPWLTGDAALSGDVAGSIRVIGRGERIDADGSMRLSAGVLRFQPDSGPEIVAEHRDGHAEFGYHDDRLEAVAGLRIGDQGVVEGRGMLGVAQPAGRPLSGELSLSLPDPAPLAVLVPQLSELSGPLQLSSQLHGTLDRPRLTLNGRWQDGRARLPELGIVLTDIDVQLSGDDDRLQLTGQASSGPGKVRLEGDLQLDAAAGWPLRLKLSGENFEVARRSDVEARVSPDLDIVAARGAISATGRLTVPYARITAKDLGRGAVRSSADEVIIGAGQPVELPAQGAGLRITANIVLALGDAVHLDAYGLTTRLTGELRLHQAAGAAAEGAGQLQLEEGRYKAYGQDLTIDRGRLLFSGPLQNPELDVRASRKAGNVTAGLLLSGSLQKPGVQLFSEPVMEQAEVLSYLVTGGPISSGSGSVSPLALAQAAAGLGLEKSGELTGQLGSSLGLDELKVEGGAAGIEGSVMAIGKQLSPDLYLRYLYGLFDNSASVQIRYLLTKRLRLEGQAGQQRSADVIYEVETD